MKHTTLSRAKAIANKTSRLYICKLQSYSYMGMFTGLVFYCLSMLPSLLPRPWLFQALVSAISLAVGYGIGAGIASVWRWLDFAQPSKSVMTSLWRISYVIFPIIMIGYIYMGAIAQREVHLLAGAAAPENTYAVRVLLISVSVAAVLIVLGRQTRRLARFLTRKLLRVVPERPAKALAFGLTTIFTIWLFSGAFFNFFVTTANRLYAVRNKQTPSAQGVASHWCPRSHSAEKAESLLAAHRLLLKFKPFMLLRPKSQLGSMSDWIAQTRQLSVLKWRLPSLSVPTPLTAKFLS